jgi:ketosteroid isomerase-like protein
MKESDMTLTPEQKKETAVRMLHASDRGDAETALQLIDDDFHFQFMERADSWTVDGQEVSTRLNKDMFLKYGINAVKEITVDGMHFTVDHVMVDGDYVAIFGESHATSKKGKSYNNTYCWRMRFSGDKIVEFLEYCDTHHAHTQLFE